MKGYTLYAKSTGMEIKVGSKVREEKPAEGKSVTGKEGRIALRFFTFGNGDTQSLRFILTPLEAYGIYLASAQIARQGGKHSLIHKFQGEEGEVTSTLLLEKWENQGKSGFAYSLKRGDAKSVNVPMDMTSFLYVGELMKSLSVEQAWSSYKETDEPGETAATHAAASGGSAGPVKK